MSELLALVLAPPLLGFVLLFVLADSWPERAIAYLTVFLSGLTLLIAAALAWQLLAMPPGYAHELRLWNWVSVGPIDAGIGLRLDGLSLLMTLVVTGVGFLVQVYSTAYMAGDEGYRRYFANLNLFIAMMLVLVLASDLLLLYLGWEGVGLCSYLLIGHWYRELANGAAARKAFIMTRIGDTALLIGLIVLATELESLDIQTVLERSRAEWVAGETAVTFVAALLLAGALGKSAQLPLQTWLPDAMAGPTPISALIHAATMVTAGVYLIARLNELYALAPLVQNAIAAIGALTLLLAAASALVQTDLKRALAYSTISQIGYMFLGLGVGAYTAAMFHFLTHACFKALLFLAAGVALHAVGESDIRRLGGLRHTLPATFWAFLIGAASLAALPYITAGFYSKELILVQSWTSPLGGPWLWFAATLGALLTAVYAFRLVYIAFLGQAKTVPHERPAFALLWPLAVLSVLALGIGFVETPGAMVSSLLTGTLPPAVHAEAPVIELIGLGAPLLGLVLAHLLYRQEAGIATMLSAVPGAAPLRQAWLKGWLFDALYDRLLVRPFFALRRANRRDLADLFYDGVAELHRQAHLALSRSQNGQVRWYAAWIGAGVVILLLGGFAR